MNLANKILTAPAPDTRLVMSKLYKANICLSDIPKEAITVASNGKLYLSCDLWINEEKNKYGNIGSLSIEQTKEQREKQERKVYVGNIREITPKPKDSETNSWDEFLAQ